MRIGAFDLIDPLPDLNRPRLLMALRPWVDAGSVGTLTLSFLEERWSAQGLGRLARPGDFYDFTRYRPMISRESGQRRVSLPNTVLRSAHRAEGDDWLFLHALEPHGHGEDYGDSVVELMRQLGVREYLMVGSMYGPVPHTRPAALSGGSTDDPLRERLERFGVRTSTYEGPTTILAAVSERVREEGIASGTMLVQLPAYAQLDPDHRGRYALVAMLNALYDLSLDLEPLRREGDSQYAALDGALEQNPELKRAVEDLEAEYDRSIPSPRPDETEPGFSPELARFLEEMERKLDHPNSD